MALRLWPWRPCDVFDVHMKAYGEPQMLQRGGSWLKTPAVLGEMRRKRRGWRATCGTCALRLADVEYRRDGAEDLAEHDQHEHRSSTHP